MACLFAAENNMSGPLSSSRRREFLVISAAAGTTSSVPGSAGAATDAGAVLTKVATVDPFSSLGLRAALAQHGPPAE